MSGARWNQLRKKSQETRWRLTITGLDGDEGARKLVGDEGARRLGGDKADNVRGRNK